MAHKEIIQSYREEVNKLRRNLSQLKFDYSLEQRASDEVRKWQESFDTASSNQIERVVNEIQKRKQSEISQSANELRNSLDEFKKMMSIRLDELDAFISRINHEDEIQMDYIKFELDLIRKKIKSLHMDIVVNVIDTSKRRHSSTALTRNTLEVTKVFDHIRPQSPSSAPADSASNLFQPLKKLFRQLSSAGASYYNVDILKQEKHP